MSARRDDDVTIEAMLDAATAILSYTANQSLETFLANRMMRNAVAKNLEVLGEGAAILSLEIKEQTPYIPWSDIIGMRHRLVHHYGGTDGGWCGRLCNKTCPLTRAA